MFLLPNLQQSADRLLSNLSNAGTARANLGLGSVATHAYSEFDLAGAAAAVSTSLATHVANVSNPHSVTKAQVGLGSVENTALSTWVGSANLTTLGTVGTGTWHGTKVGLVYGGTNVDLSATGGTSQVLKQTSAGGNVTVGQLASTDISGLGTASTHASTDFEPAITAGTTAQYWRGDKSWQTLNQAAVAGLTTSDTPTFAGVITSGPAYVGRSTDDGTAAVFQVGGTTSLGGAAKISGDITFDVGGSRYIRGGLAGLYDLNLASGQNINLMGASFSPLRCWHGTGNVGGSNVIGHCLNIGGVDDAEIAFFADRTTGTTWRARGSGLNANPTIIRSTGGSIRFYADSGKTDLSTYTPTERMRITAAGLIGFGVTPLSGLDVSSVAIGTFAGANPAPPNGMIVSGQVGIGTSSPGDYLEVSRSVANQSSGITITNTAGTAWGSALSLKSTYAAGGVRARIVGEPTSNSGGDIQLQTANSSGVLVTQLKIDEAGVFTIGAGLISNASGAVITTPGPIFAFVYAAATAGYGGVSIGGATNGYGAVGANVTWGANDASNKYRISDYASWMTFDNGGFVFKTAPSGTAGGTITPTTTAKLPNLGGLVVGSAALATNATDGFIYLPTCAGAPTGPPTSQTGTRAVVYDTTNDKLWVFGSSWKGVALA